MCRKPATRKNAGAAVRAARGQGLRPCKDGRIFTGMKKRLINVRLDEERLRKARMLRQKGVILSDLVREAIDTKFDAALAAEQPRDMARMIEELFERYPDPIDLPRRTYDVRDRRAAREAIRRKLARKRK